MSAGGKIPPAISAAALEVAKQTATPFYLTSAAAIDAAAQHLESAFPDPWVRSYSLKADPLPAVVALIAERGWGANCVSRGEILAARAAGLGNERITLEGIGKGPEEIGEAIDASVAGRPFRWVAVESADEARALVAQIRTQGITLRTPIRTLIRLNPAIEPGTHAGLAVGRKSSKFGVDARELREAAAILATAPESCELIGIHMHAGSQLRDMAEWQRAVEESLTAYADLVREGLINEASHRAHGTLCVGGGEPVALDESDDPDAQARAFAAAADAAWSKASGPTPVIRAIEPGRALVAAATYLVARVLHTRQRKEIVRGSLALPGKAETRCVRQVVLDAGMGEIMRPALYGARHPVIALGAHDAQTHAVAVHGPICESTDSLGAHELPQSLTRGDLLGIAGAGAYADAMWSPYNSRPRPARLLLGARGLRTLRERSAESA
ncbi:MAG: diaminopimelate decarboxylase family protein [Candidatus Limnocylindrus sp.]